MSSQGPKEFKQALNRAKRKHASKNGVLGGWWFDNFWGLFGLDRSKKNYKRASQKRITE